jgi:LPXTG-site transpeptidase (sortase) family protein
VTGIRFSADGTEIMTASLDGSVRVWSTTDGAQRLVMESTGSPLGSFALVGQQIVAAGIDGVLTLWDISAFEDAPAVVAASTAVPPTDAPVVVQVQPTDAPAAIVQAPTQALLAVTSAPAAEAEPTSAPVYVAEAPPVGEGISLSIPTVNIYSPIITFYLDGVSWAIDPWENHVGYLQGTAWVDVPGNIALGGHSEYPDGTPGIFNGLYGVNIGDPIYLNVNGSQRRYIVTEKRSVRFDDLSVVYPTTSERLTLITCDIPSYDAGTNFYWERLVVVAVPG